MKKVSILLLSTLAFGCQHAPQQQQPAPGMLPKYHVAAPLSLFSTYPSDTMQSLCSDISIGSSPCAEDALEGHLFVKALSESNWFDRILPASSEADYELLIASLASDLPKNDSPLSMQTLTAGLWNDDTTTHYFTELTVQWRGIEIASEIFDTVRQPDQSDEKLVEEAQRISGIATMKDLVDFALRELVRRHEISKLLDLEGQIDWDGDLNAMRAGRELCES